MYPVTLSAVLHYMYIQEIHTVLCAVLVTQAIEVAVDALRSHTLNLNPIVDGHTIKVPLPK